MKAFRSIIINGVAPKKTIGALWLKPEEDGDNFTLHQWVGGSWTPLYLNVDITEEDFERIKNAVISAISSEYETAEEIARKYVSKSGDTIIGVITFMNDIIVNGKSTFNDTVNAFHGIDVKNNYIKNLATPVDSKDAVNKAYLDNINTTLEARIRAEQDFRIAADNVLDSKIRGIEDVIPDSATSTNTLTTVNWVNRKLSDYIPKTGGTFTGDVNIDEGDLYVKGQILVAGGEILMTDDPTSDMAAINKGYVDTELANKQDKTDVVFEKGTGTNSAQQKGTGAIASGPSSHAEGTTYNNVNTSASADAAHAEGAGTTAKGQASHSEGVLSVAGRTQSEAVAAVSNFPNLSGNTEQKVSKLIGFGSHVEGTTNKALGSSSHAEGYSTQALVNSTHAEGDTTTASGEAAHSEGYKTTASGNQAHAEGYNTEATANQSHAEGESTTASGINSHAEGYRTYAYGAMSHTEGVYTVANNNVEHAEGQYNKSNKANSTFGDAGNTIHSVGIGTSSQRKNAFEIMQNGDAYLIGVGDYDGTNPAASTPINQLIGPGGSGATIITASSGNSLVITLPNGDKGFNGSYRIDMTAAVWGGDVDARYIGSLIIECNELATQTAHGYYYGDDMDEILSEVAIWKDDPEFYPDEQRYFLLLTTNLDLNEVIFSVSSLDGQSVDAIAANDDENVKVADATITQVGVGEDEGYELIRTITPVQDVFRYELGDPSVYEEIRITSERPDAPASGTITQATLVRLECTRNGSAVTYNIVNANNSLKFMKASIWLKGVLIGGDCARGNSASNLTPIPTMDVQIASDVTPVNYLLTFNANTSFDGTETIRVYGKKRK